MDGWGLAAPPVVWHALVRRAGGQRLGHCPTRAGLGRAAALTLHTLLALCTRFPPAAVITKTLHVPPPAAAVGLGLDSVLPAVVERIPPPRGNPGGDLKMLLFDAYHDEYR